MASSAVGAALALAAAWVGSAQSKSYDVVVYGGSVSGYSALISLAKVRPQTKALLIVPQSRMGEIAAVAAQNFWDVLPSRNRYVGGTMARLYARTGHGYDPQLLSQILLADLRKNKNLEIVFRQDLEGVEVQEGRVVAVRLRGLTPDARGIDRFAKGEAVRIAGRVFVDASYNGRLLRLGGFTGITGRQDLDPTSTRQQAVTLMYAVTGIDPKAATRKGLFKVLKDEDGGRSIYGGEPFPAPYQKEFSERLFLNRFRFKGPNIAEGKRGQWWINGLIMYGVDGTKELKDEGTARFPRNDLISVDEAYLQKKAMVRSPEHMKALRGYPGFGKAQVVDQADMLYVRETVHSSLKPNPTPDDFAMTNADFANAGTGPDNGRDRRHHARRIGLAYYLMDSQGYYMLGQDPLAPRIHRMAAWRPENPAYVPYDVMLNPAFENVLICGYGVNASSVAWYPLRVLPNLTMIGDAAGVSAGLALEWGRAPSRFDNAQVARVRERLKALGAKLDKS